MNSSTTTEGNKKIKVFAEYLQQLRVVNLYVSGEEYIVKNIPTISIKSNVIEIPSVGNCKITLEDVVLQDSINLSPRTLENNTLCYRLVVRPDSKFGSANAEVVSNFEKTLDEGAKNLVNNSINTVALKEETLYKIHCRFCSTCISDTVKFDRIRPLPSNSWVENAHELWYCHPPEPTQSQGLQPDLSNRLNNINLLDPGSCSSQTIVDLLKSPHINYCFYGPCNWALNKNVVSGVCKNSTIENYLGSRAECRHCGNELGSFTSELCVKIWDYAVRWEEVSPRRDPSYNQSCSGIQTTEERAACNFKSIVFATIYELSDHPTFRFSVSSVDKGNSVFLWIIDRNLCVYRQKNIEIDSNEITTLERCKVAKFFFAVKENNVLSILDSKEILIIQEAEENEQNVLIIPNYVFRAGINLLKTTSELYSRDERTLQCGYLIYDA